MIFPGWCGSQMRTFFRSQISDQHILHIVMFGEFYFRALFIMLDSLQNEEPEIRLVKA